MAITKFHKVILAVAFIVYLITAINSKGYLHYDEHYQIIEFANFKLGATNAEDLAWEYNAKIRPALQPAIAFVVFKIAGFIGITDAYVKAFVLRLITLLLALTAISLFVKSSLFLVAKETQKLYILLSYFLWFLPFLNVRFSSETWSGLLFLLSVALLQLNVLTQKRLFVLAGLLLGLSFLCRCQAAFLIIGLLGWLIIVHKSSIKNIIIIIVAAGFMVLLGVAIDRWFYNEWVFTPWNYFKINIVQGVAAQFGTLPWHTYFGTILKAPVLPFGVLILGSLCLLIYKIPNLLLLWVIIPFIVVHSFISHKEDRFLIPLMNFVPLLIVLGWQQVKAQSVNNNIKRFAAYIFTILLLIINVLGLAVMAVSSLGYGTKAITNYIHNNYKGKSVNLVYSEYTNPYNVLYWLQLKERFYVDENVTEINMQQFLQIPIDNIIGKQINLLAFRKADLNSTAVQQIIASHHLTFKTQSMPLWVDWVTQYYYNADSRSIIMLYGNR